MLPAGRSRLHDYLDRRLVAAGSFLALTLLMTFPLALHFSSALPAGYGDIWQNYWNFWWWKKALLELHQHPYHTQYLFHPTGAGTIFHTHSSFNMLLGLPLTAALGPAAAYNFCVLMAVWLSGLGTYLLVRDLTGDARAGVLAGIVFAFFPHRMEEILEHLNLMSVQFIPLTLFFFFRLCRQGGRRNIAGLGICFALNALCSWHLGLKLILILLPLAVVQYWRPARQRAAILRDSGLAALIATAILFPLVQPMVAEMWSGETYYQKAQENTGADPAFFFIPQYEHPLWRELTSWAYVDRAYYSAGFMTYLGFVPVALALFALWRKQRGAVFWAVFTLAALLLALGKHPYWNGHLFENITLPFAVFAEIPVFRLLRSANRFLTLTGLGLAVLAGLAWMAMKRKTDMRFALLAALILLDYAWLPFPIRTVEISPIYEKLAAAGRRAIIDAPSMQRSRGAHNMVAQTVHERPIADGYLSTGAPKAEAFIAQDPALSDLIGVPKLERPLDRDHLLALGFDTFVLHKYRADGYARERDPLVPLHHISERKYIGRLGGVPDDVMDRLRAELTACCGEPAFEDGKIVVFYLERGR